MPKLFGLFKTGIHKGLRRFCLEELETRVLPAVVAGAAGCASSEIVSSPLTEDSFPLISAGDTAEKLEVSLVVSYSPAAVSQTNTLEDSVAAAQTDDILYAQIWVRNADESLQGCAGGYLDLIYTDSVFEAGLFTSSGVFPNMAVYASPETPGRVAMVGGMCSPGQTSLAVDSWALLGTFSFMVVGEGRGVIQSATPTYDGTETEAFNLARLGVGTLASSEIVFGSAAVTVSGEGGQLAAPSIITGNAGHYSSYGLNRHLISWGAVANASSYELAWSADGLSWDTLITTELSAVAEGLSYGALESYRVRALGDGSLADSDWSAVKSFYVCPIDINGDGDITGADRTIISKSWLSSEGDDEFAYYSDINGDGDITGPDRVYLSANWLLSIEDDFEDFRYPPAQAFWAGDDVFDPLLDTGFDLF